jgi:flavin reductase (DIM6/NTAB) family NADH-FMN oxidoreductase RutF
MRDRQQRFRALMGRFVTGVTVIGVRGGLGDRAKVRAMTANAVTAVSLDPLLLLMCIRNESQLLPAVLCSKRFSVNVLASGQDDISRHYGGRPQSPCPARWGWHADDVPLLAGANASFACRVHASHRVGDHTVIYGEVFDMTAADPAAPALVYAAGRYHGVSLAA